MKESVAIAKEANTKKDFSPTRSDKYIHRVRNEPERQLGSLRSVINNIRHDGGTPSVDSIATELSSMPTVPRASVLLALQQTHGNRYVQRVVTGIQAKLKVGQPGDVYEQEADRVADAVMRMPEVMRQAEEEEEESLQAKPLTEQITPLVQRQVEEEKEEEEEILQAKAHIVQTPEVALDFESRVQALKGGGQPLSESARVFFEPRFGYDFSQVRIHTDAKAAETAHALNARAFTLGQDVAFGAGQYAPGTSAGKKLLAHELTHVIQQRVVGFKQPQSAFLQRDEISSTEIEMTGGSFHSEEIELYGPPSHAKGHIGEIEAAHILGRKYGMENVIMAPKQLVNTAGIDTIIYDATNDQVLFIDNKATKAERIGSVTALTKNLSKNTKDARAFIESLPEGPGGIDPKLKQNVLNAMDNGRITLRVTTAFGKGTKLGSKLVPAGVEIEPLELKPLPKVPPATEKLPPTKPPKAPTKAPKAPSPAAPSAKPTMRPPVIKAGGKGGVGPGKQPPKGMGLKGGPSPVKGALISVGAGIVGGLLTSWMHDKIRESVKNMPPPTINQVLIWEKEGMRNRTSLDLVASDLPKVLEEFVVGRVKFTFDVLAFWHQLDATPLITDKLELLDGFEQAVLEDQIQLMSARRNVREALKLEPQIQEAIQAAEELQALVESGFGYAFLFYSGLSVEEISKISSNLAWFQAAYSRGVLQPLHRLETELDKQIYSDDELLCQIEEIRRKGFIEISPPHTRQVEEAKRKEFIEISPHIKR